MNKKKRQEVENFVQIQKEQLGLDENEVQDLLQTALQESEAVEPDDNFEDEIGLKANIPTPAPASAAIRVKSARRAPLAAGSREQAKSKRKKMSDPYLPQSQTIQVRPTKVSKFRSIFFEHALPNEYIVQIGIADAKPVLGGKFFKLGKQYLKFPAAVQTVYFTSDNANKNYQGLKIDGYACWRIDPESPELAARTLDFTDQENPMGNTNRILRTICTEAIRHIIANTTIEEALTKKDEIGRDLKAQLERIERTWGITFDQVGIERVTILSESVFDDLQQKTRDQLRLSASESRMVTDRDIEKKQAEYSQEMDHVRSEAEKESRILKATTESEVHKVELEEEAKRDSEIRKAEEAKRKAEAESGERAAEHRAEQAKRQASREAEIEAHRENEKRGLHLARAASEAEIRINTLESEARVAEAEIQGELQKSRAEHERRIQEQDFENERKAKTLAMEQGLAADQQSAELTRAEAAFDQTVKERRRTAELENEIEIKRLERMRTEREVANLVSPNRLLADFVEKLPDIASSQQIDRYTVYDGSGGSPLFHTLDQIISVLEEHGLAGLLKKTEDESGEGE